jgi:hypothetical protein
MAATLEVASLPLAALEVAGLSAASFPLAALEVASFPLAALEVAMAPLEAECNAPLESESPRSYPVIQTSGLRSNNLI